MRLLHLDPHKRTWILENFSPPRIPFYAILSHTWGRDIDEISFKDIEGGDREYGDTTKLGYEKLRFCQKQVEKDGLRYFWIDTCCIQKSDSVELQKSLNSMFYWYKKATTCYVWLSDVSIGDATNDANREWEMAFTKSRWFKRGWTLQELIAPESVGFFSEEGDFIGDKRQLVSTISNTCNIPSSALEGVELSHFSTEQRFSWAQGRLTSVPEDSAYCLFGIFGVEPTLSYADGVYNERKKMALDKLRKAIKEKELSSKHPNDMIRIGGAFWHDLNTLSEEQLLKLDADLDEYCKWFLDIFPSQYTEAQFMSTKNITNLSQNAGKRMERLLANHSIRYEDLSHFEARTLSWKEAWGRYRDKHAHSQKRIQGFVQNRWYWAREHDDLFKAITAARTLESLMIWRGTWDAS